MDQTTLTARRHAPLAVPHRIGEAARRDLGAALAQMLADVFALYLKTRNFHWHYSGPGFRDGHLMLDDMSAELLAMTDPMAERARKLGQATLRSTGQIARLQRILDNEAEFVTPSDMLAELRDDNGALADRLAELHGLCDLHGDVATASLVETWIDEAEGRRWFLFEMLRKPL
ncbi:Dps family protein [Poseidonocella sp. HB161398]|uniref:Dps family protein n=1 Tax=Poseidonocella sp. HB161398 TaxID=2320855 RepID=UPI001108BFA1|nr:DNA starvation/stationary phase protection protein [Poseidonocella sp. HB161398]